MLPELTQRVNLELENNIVSIASLNANAISGDGRYISIASEVSGTLDENFHDIFVYDRSTQTLEKPNLRLSQSFVNGSNFDPVLDVDGRFMAFTSDDSGLVNGDTNNASDIFVYDRNSQLVTRVSQLSNGAQANRGSSSPTISGDGRYIAFSFRCQQSHCGRHKCTFRHLCCGQIDGSH